MLRKAIISAIILILAVAAWGAAMRSFASQPVSVDYRALAQGGEWKHPEPFVRLASAQRVATDEVFGLCFVSAAENLADEARYAGALEAGARWDRWPLYWQWVDQGGYVGFHDTAIPHDYDTLVIQEIEHGLSPIAILLGTPDQRATGGSADVPPPRVQDKVFPSPGRIRPQQGETSTAASPPIGLFEPIFADGTDVPAPGKAVNQANSWADFVSNTVQRYKPGGDLAQDQGWGDDIGVRYWEIWNEPDLDQFWSGTVEEYYRLLEVGYQAIQAADPEATVILGGLAFFEKQNWLSDLLAQTGGDPAKAYFDVFSFHYYWSIYGTEYWLWRARSTLSANGLSDVPIWITESGVPVWDDFPATEFDGGVPPDSPYRGTMEEQAAYVIQNAALAFYQGVERYYHFMLHDDCGNVPGADAFGLRQNFTPHVCSPAQGKHRPSYAAYQLAAEQFRDLTPLWRTKGSGQDRVAFYRADDSSRVLALWATGGVAVTATIKATGDTGQLHWIEPTSSPLGTTGISRTLTITPTDGIYTLTLPPATNRNSGIPGDSNYYIGGRPYLLVERDTLSPTSSVEPLPLASVPAFVVRWGGQDWGSGIASFDVFYNVDGGPLTTWITETLAVSAPFTGTVDSTYGFAARARDRAGNVEPEPSEPQAQTTIAEGAMAGGRVTDNTTQPVAGAQVALTSEESATYTAITDEEGLWRVEGLSPATYTVTASAPGYGQWPAPRRLVLSELSVLDFDLNLPPLVNLVLDGDFEAGLENWMPGGSTAPQISGESFDGQQALVLGKDFVGQPELGGGGNSTLHQSINIPSDTTSPHLSFVYRLVTEETVQGSDWFEAIIIEGDEVAYPIQPGDEWQNTDGWRQLSFDLSSWQSHAFDLYFNVWQSSAQNPTLVYVDEVSVGSARLPLCRIFLPLAMK
ncbi:MAG: carboxypeptidase regulatory-like domain-containing protein [Chloroflexi bacterium]|nr:carboxypeptidase regulatory-like domain-containing protein [Chloroflexota bacterium]